MAEPVIAADPEKWLLVSKPGPARAAEFFVYADRGRMKTVVLAVFVFSAAVGAYATSVHYDNQFSDFYPEISTAAVAIPPGTPLEKDVTVWSEFRNRKATLVRSDATKIPYDKEIGAITIESPNRPKQYIRLRRFRTIEIKWINDRLLYINCDIGHTASVDAIFDAQTGKWIYRQSMSYGND